jgi:hypothetical protein
MTVTRQTAVNKALLRNRPALRYSSSTPSVTLVQDSEQPGATSRVIQQLLSAQFLYPSEVAWQLGMAECFVSMNPETSGQLVEYDPADFTQP